MNFCGMELEISTSRESVIERVRTELAAMVAGGTGWLSRE
jgi:hypothetical protein